MLHVFNNKRNENKLVNFNSTGWFNLLGLRYHLCPLHGSGP